MLQSYQGTASAITTLDSSTSNSDIQFPPKPDWHKLIRSGNRLFVGSGVSVPNALIDDLIDNRNGFHDLQILHGHTLAPNRWVNREFDQLFSVNTFYIGNDEVRAAVAEGRADYTPSKHSEMSNLFSTDDLPLDAALLMVSPPDEYGYCSLGTSVDINLSAAKKARHVIVQINPLMPRTNGYSHLHISEFAACIEAEQALPEYEQEIVGDEHDRIGQYLASLVDNGATLQIGFGAAPRSALKYLGNHKDLGIHSGILIDDMVDLFKSGVINNRRKTFHPGKILTTACYGSQKLYNFVDGNPHVEFYPCGYIESASNIARNDNMTSINNALQVDLGGQVVSDSVGYYFYSGIGGKVDFINGAAMSNGGKPIIALKSTANNGRVSRIVPHITEGAGIVNTRGNVHYVVTEYGIASLKGKSIRERALELIRIAHPAFRKELLREVRKNFWVPDYQKAVPMEIPEYGRRQVKDFKIGNSTFKLRPLNPSDERHLQSFFYSLTRESLRLRYSSVPSQMTREKSCTLVSVDQTKDVALCIVKERHPEIDIEAVGRFYKIDADNSCEVAFVTREDFQGKGMAKTLLKEMIFIAKERGLSKIRAHVLAENKPMLKVFQKNGFKRTLSDDIHEVQMVLNLQEEEQSQS
ncbi:MAG: hypothetical protein AseanaTS_15790 [Candidatus Pelagadaptatus aseana]|uniref:GNAT family N-acetyltransferase n=1 Tax=Candidatus Pelagadaptatus aseana TaxID=3120508 RepID=UPI0039B30818